MVTRTHDGDRGLTRAERSERTADLVDQVCRCRSRRRHDELCAEIITINRGVAEAVASRYRNRGVPQEDLNQVAYEGLTKAVQRFDPATGNDLLTYAVPTIRGELQRYFRDHSWTVRPPRRIQELQWRLGHTVEDLEQELGRSPSDQEVAEELEVSEVDYVEAMRAFGCFQPTSLDQPVGAETETSMGDLIADDAGTDDASEARVLLAPVVRGLSARERRILHLRFFEDRTQAEIGVMLGVTQMQVSRLLGRILQRLRAELEREPDSAPIQAGTEPHAF